MGGRSNGPQITYDPNAQGKLDPSGQRTNAQGQPDPNGEYWTKPGGAPLKMKADLTQKQDGTHVLSESDEGKQAKLDNELAAQKKIEENIRNAAAQSETARKTYNRRKPTKSGTILTSPTGLGGVGSSTPTSAKTLLGM